MVNQNLAWNCGLATTLVHCPSASGVFDSEMLSKYVFSIYFHLYHWTAINIELERKRRQSILGQTPNIVETSHTVKWKEKLASSKIFFCVRNSSFFVFIKLYWMFQHHWSVVWSFLYQVCSGECGCVPVLQQLLYRRMEEHQGMFTSGSTFGLLKKKQ